MKFCGDEEASLVMVKRSSANVEEGLMEASPTSYFVPLGIIEPLNSLQGQDNKVAFTPDDGIDKTTPSLVRIGDLPPHKFHPPPP